MFPIQKTNLVVTIGAHQTNRCKLIYMCFDSNSTSVITHDSPHVVHVPKIHQNHVFVPPSLPPCLIYIQRIKMNSSNSPGILCGHGIFRISVPPPALNTQTHSPLHIHIHTHTAQEEENSNDKKNNNQRQHVHHAFSIVEMPFPKPDQKHKLIPSPHSMDC